MSFPSTFRAAGRLLGFDRPHLQEQENCFVPRDPNFESIPSCEPKDAPWFLSKNSSTSSLGVLLRPLVLSSGQRILAKMNTYGLTCSILVVVSQD